MLQSHNQKYYKRVSIRDNKKICIAVMMPSIVLSIQCFILFYFGLLDSGNSATVQLISLSLVGLAFLYVFPTVLKYSLNKTILIYLIALFIVMLHYVIFPDNQEYIKNLIFPLFFTCLPAFIYVLTIDDWDIFRQIIEVSSLIIFVTISLLSILIFTGLASMGIYSMALSYYMLIPTIVYLNKAMDDSSIKHIAYVSISILVILALGSRGPILCILIFFILKFVSFMKKLSYKVIIICMLGFMTGILFLTFRNDIFLWLEGLFVAMGISSRTITLFLGESVHMSGRDYIYLDLINSILNSPLLGTGLMGDRLLLDGTYAHNIFIEILVNFGLIFGSIIILTLLVLLIRGLLSKNIGKYNMIIIWTSIGFIPLMVSASYLIYINFWIFLGILLRMKYSKLDS